MLLLLRLIIPGPLGCLFDFYFRCSAHVSTPHGRETELDVLGFSRPTQSHRSIVTSTFSSVPPSLRSPVSTLGGRRGLSFSSIRRTTKPTLAVDICAHGHEKQSF